MAPPRAPSHPPPDPAPTVTAADEDDDAPAAPPTRASLPFAATEPSPGRHDDLAFSVGTVIAGRYRLVRFIARGGMGEVYEAEDFELGGRVALKTLRGERVRDTLSLERFRREIAVSRRITHRNVGRLFDVGFHAAPGEQQPTMFLTMELLLGESLAERLARTGRMEPVEALPLVEQMAAALAAAHEAGVVHRDFKPANVMLVEGAGSAPLLRAVVTDFGLARAVEESDEWASLSSDGALLGSPSYMAPEQVEGKPVTAAADIYAFGVVLFQMVTGELPFTAPTAMATAALRLSVDPRAPSTYVPALDRAWDAAIVRCLKRAPEERFASIGDVLRALRSAAPAPVPPRRRVSARALVGIGAVVVVSGVALATVGRARFGPTPAPAPSVSAAPAVPSARVEPEIRRSVAVLGFDNLARDATRDWLATALAQLLNAELSTGQELRTVASERVAQARRDLRLTSADAASGDVLARVRQNLGVDLVVFGSFLEQKGSSGTTLRVQVVLKDAATGESLASLSELGTEADLFDLVGRAGAKLRERLGLGTLSPEARVTLRSALPASREAARLYAEGILEQEHYQNIRAKELLTRAVAAAPDFALGYAVLARAVEGLGRDEEAKGIAKKALDLATTLSREERLTIEGQFYAASKDWARAIAAYQALFKFFPDNVDYGVRLANTQMKGGHGADALQTVAELRALPYGMGDDPRIDIEEARAAHGTSKYDLCLSAASRAMEKGRARQNWSLVGRAGYFAGIALGNLGRVGEGIETLRKAREISTEYGDPLNAAIVQSPLAGFYVASGQLALARREMEAAHASLSAMGNAYYAASAWERLGGLDFEEGNVVSARRRMETAMVEYRAAGANHALSTALPALARVKALQGDLDGARAFCDEGVAIAQKIGRKVAEADGHLCKANVARQRGDVDAERVSGERAAELARAAGSKSVLARALDAIGERQRGAGDLAGARRSLEEALAIKEGLGERMRAADTRVALARLAIDEQRPADAEAESKRAAEDLGAAGARGGQVRAMTVRARALMALGKVDEARAEVDAAAQLARGSADVELAELVKTTSARVRAARADAGAVNAAPAP